jgi:amino acid transporter
MAVFEYIVLIGVSIWGLVFVLTHHAGTFPITSGWFSLSGIGGKGDLAAGLLIAVFMYSGWDATIYVNEEVKHRRVNPGRAALFAVAILIVLYILPQMGLQGVSSPAKLQANSASALIYVTQVLGGGGWAKLMAVALVLSVIASTGTGIVASSRISYGMASHRVLPFVFGQISRRFNTPAIGSIIIAAILIAATWAYLLSTSIANVFTDVVSVTGLLFACFYVLTALAAIVYYRRQIFSRIWDSVVIGILPLGSAAFLVWVVIKSLQNAPNAQRYALVGIVAVGLVMMVIARFGMRSEFFRLPRESAPRNTGGQHRG